MSYKFSVRSLEKLNTLHPDLKVLLQSLIKHYDFSIIEGHRGQEKQDNLFESGMSKVKYPNSKHNMNPSKAVDIQPYPIDFDALSSGDYKEYGRFYFMLGMAKAMAIGLKRLGKMSHDIRLGADWDSDNELKDQTFDDLFHIELVD